MKKHVAVFEKIKELLVRLFPDQIEEVERENHLSIDDTGIWIASDERELTVGYGMIHFHCDPEFDNLNEVIEKFFNLIVRRKRITEYFKGDFCYKYTVDLELDNDNFKSLGTSMTWLYPFWKKSKTKVTYQNELINQSKIEKEIIEIKNYAQ